MAKVTAQNWQCYMQVLCHTYTIPAANCSRLLAIHTKPLHVLLLRILVTQYYSTMLPSCFGTQQHQYSQTKKTSNYLSHWASPPVRTLVAQPRCSVIHKMLSLLRLQAYRYLSSLSRYYRLLLLAQLQESFYSISSSVGSRLGSPGIPYYLSHNSGS